VQLLGQPLRYQMTLEPSRLPLLPLLELTPERADAAPVIEGLHSWQRSDLQWQTDRPVAERLRFEAAAWLLHRHGPRQPTPALHENLMLPPRFNPRSLAWAAELRAKPELAQADARTLAAALLEHLRAGGFSYTLEPGAYPGAHAVDDFWFDRKLGFCEHFAAGMVVMLRAMQVPARVVTGYMGADPAPVDGWHIVRQSNAHAWVEYWQEGEGWVRSDPTAAVSPQRVVRGTGPVPRPGLVEGAIASVDPQLLARLRTLLEATNNRWNQWVMNYSRAQQFSLLESLGVDAPSWHDLAYALVALLCAASLGAAGWALWDRHRQDPWQRLQQRVQRQLARLRVVVQPHEPPRTRARRVREQLGAAGEALALQLEALDRARYARPGRSGIDRGWWRRFAAAAAQAARR